MESYETNFQNANDPIKPPLPSEGNPVAQESYWGGLIGHIKQNKIVYFALLAGVAYVVYKKFIKK
jgi:hypothetical protein